MATNRNDAGLISDIRTGSLEEDSKTVGTCSSDVRSIVEQQYSLMEQAHDRIRIEELAAHRRERLT